MDCKHIQKSGFITRSYAGEVFKAKGLVCVECGAQLWDKDAEGKFETWLRSKLRDKTFRDRLKVQKIPLSQNAIDFIEEFKLSYFVDESKVIQAVLSVYVNKIRDNEHLNSLVSEISVEGPFVKIRSGVRLNPVLYRRLSVTAEIFDLSLGACAGEIINRVAILVKSVTSKTVRDDIDAIVSAA